MFGLLFMLFYLVVCAELHLCVFCNWVVLLFSNIYYVLLFSNIYYVLYCHLQSLIALQS